MDRGSFSALSGSFWLTAGLIYGVAFDHRTELLWPAWEACHGGPTYAQELCEPGVRRLLNNEEARIEKSHVNASGEDEICFSWWKKGKIVPRRLGLSEEDLVLLFKDAPSKDVFTPAFRMKLRTML